MRMVDDMALSGAGSLPGFKSILQGAGRFVGDVFAPLVPALISGGFALGLGSALGDAPAPFALAVFRDLLILISHAALSLLPAGVCWSVSRALGADEPAGIVLGLALVGGNGAAVALGAPLPGGAGLDGQVLPAIAAALLNVALARALRRIVPRPLRGTAVTLGALAATLLLTIALIGPALAAVGDALASAVFLALGGPLRCAFAAAIGLAYAPLVMTGLHHFTIIVDMQMVACLGYTALWPLLALSNVSQGAAALAVAILDRADADRRGRGASAAVSCFLGVTEPALFGVNRPRGYPLWCAAVGSACASAVSAGFRCGALSIGIGGVPGILSLRAGDWGAFALALLAAVAVPFLLTLAVGAVRRGGPDSGSG